MLLPPARTNWLETVPLVPDVFPPEKPIETAGAPMLIVLPADAMLTAPVPLIDDVAGTLWPDSARFSPLLLSVRLPEIFVPLKLVLVPATVTDPDDPLTCCTYDVGTVGTVYDAVRTDELDRPKDMPLLFANDSVPDV